MHLEMSNAMKRLKKLGGFGKLAAMFNKGGMEEALGVLLPAASSRRNAGTSRRRSRRSTSPRFRQIW
jgi:hypothetical protein